MQTDLTKFSKIDNSVPLDLKENDLNPKFRNRFNLDDKEEKINYLEDQFISNNNNKKENLSSGILDAGLNSFDFSICFALWVFSAGAILLLFVFFKFRRSRHKFVKNFYSDYKV